MSRGDDIDKLAKIPQNFDLIAYPSDSDDVNYAQSNPKYSVGEDNNFEILSPFSASKDYMIFIIQLRSDDSSDEYKGQIALGFDLIAY